MQIGGATAAGSTAGGRVRAATAAQAVLALVLGAFIVFGAGLSHISAVHNAAHDARHSAGFPCH
jgi:cobalt transporter subunit CbtB